MAIRFVPDADSGDPDIPGVDRHFYENQALASGGLDNAFEIATARAKDEARHQLIKAVKITAERSEADIGRFDEAASFLSGERLAWTRVIDGIEGAPDNDIKV